MADDGEECEDVYLVGAGETKGGDGADDGKWVGGGGDTENICRGGTEKLDAETEGMIAEAEKSEKEAERAAETERLEFEAEAERLQKIRIDAEVEKLKRKNAARERAEIRKLKHRNNEGWRKLIHG